MFTGLIECKGKVEGVERRGHSLRMFIAPEPEDFSPADGESVAVDGVCLTVTGFKGNSFSVDVSSESLERTTLGKLKKGSEVNLERSLRVGDRLGGHMVQGHVDGVGNILEVGQEGEFKRIRISAPAEVMRYIVEKGSVAVDGISLTVNERGDKDFTLMLIPETLKRTTLGNRKRGAHLNLESDLIAKYVERLLFDKKETRDKITLDKLKEEGFL